MTGAHRRAGQGPRERHCGHRRFFEGFDTSGGRVSVPAVDRARRRTAFSSAPRGLGLCRCTPLHSKIAKSSLHTEVPSMRSRVPSPTSTWTPFAWLLACLVALGGPARVVSAQTPFVPY